MLLPSEKGRLFVKFNVDGLLRGDYKSRMEGYAIARQNGWMSANDIRELENLNRISPDAGGDLYLVNGNMLPLEKAGAYASEASQSTVGEERNDNAPSDDGRKETQNERKPLLELGI